MVPLILLQITAEIWSFVMISRTVSVIEIQDAGNKELKLLNY